MSFIKVLFGVRLAEGWHIGAGEQEGGRCWGAPRKFAKSWQPGHLPQEWLVILTHNSKWCEVFCIGKIIWCSFCWCTPMAPSLHNMGVAYQNFRCKNWQYQLHLRLVFSKLVPPKRLLQELIGCWIASMLYLSSTKIMEMKVQPCIQDYSMNLS